MNKDQIAAVRTLVAAASVGAMLAVDGMARGARTLNAQQQRQVTGVAAAVKCLLDFCGEDR